MTLENLKELFKTKGYFVDDVNNVVILRIERVDKGHIITSADLERLAKNWDNILANRDKNGWDEILKKLGL